MKARLTDCVTQALKAFLSNFVAVSTHRGPEISIGPKLAEHVSSTKVGRCVNFFHECRSFILLRKNFSETLFGIRRP